MHYMLTIYAAEAGLQDAHVHLYYGSKVVLTARKPAGASGLALSAPTTST